MFYVLDKFQANHGGVIRTIYGVDRATNSFLTTNFLGGFEWIPIDECEIYEPEDEE